MSIENFQRAQHATLASYGVAATSRFLDVEGGKAHVLVHGEGPPLVMVNGIGTPAAMWAPLIAALDGVTVYAVDLPGFGLTERTEPFVPNLRRHVVDFLASVLDVLDLERPAFVSNSLGSLSVTWLALDRPHRVAHMAHVGCPALLLGTSAPLPMRLLSVPGLGALLERVQPPSARQVRGMAKMVGEEPLPEELVDLLVATEKLPLFAPAFRPVLRQLVRLRGARPGAGLTPEQLAALTQPVALVWGADDPFGEPAIGEAAASFIRDAEFHLVPGGHVPWVHHPNDVARAIGPFLRRHQAAAA